MHHLQPFRPRDVVSLPLAEKSGWRLKRYAILADDRKLNHKVISAALDKALQRLPQAGKLSDQDGNHGIGFQIVHFAEVAVVSPVFYWQWGSVLANIPQMRAPWDAPTEFDTGVKEVVGCVWEMEIISFEVNAWATTLLGNTGTISEKLKCYFAHHFPATRVQV